MLRMKSDKKETTEGIKELNQENTRTLREKENYKYLKSGYCLRIKRKKAQEKSTSEEKEIFLKSSSIAEISLKNKHLACPPCKILWIIITMDVRETHVDGQK